MKTRPCLRIVRLACKHFNKLSQREVFAFVVISLGGLAGGFLSDLRHPDPLASRESMDYFYLIFGVAAAWVGVYVVLGSEVVKLVRRFALSVVCGFAGVAVIESTQSFVGVKEKVDFQSALNQEKLIQERIRQIIRQQELQVDGARIENSAEAKIQETRNRLAQLLSMAAAYPSMETDGMILPTLFVGLDTLEDGVKQAPRESVQALRDLSGLEGLCLSDYMKGLLKRHLRNAETSLQAVAASTPIPNLAGSEVASSPATAKPTAQIGNMPGRGASPSPSPIGLSTASPTPEQESAVGFIRVANYGPLQSQNPKWDDILIRSAQGNKNRGFPKPTGAEPENEMLDLNAKYVVEADIFLRSDFPSVNEKGLLFAPSIAVIKRGSLVTVTRAAIRSNKSLSQLWAEVSVNRNDLLSVE